MLTWRGRAEGVVSGNEIVRSIDPPNTKETFDEGSSRSKKQKMSFFLAFRVMKAKMSFDSTESVRQVLPWDAS